MIWGPGSKSFKCCAWEPALKIFFFLLNWSALGPRLYQGDPSVQPRVRTGPQRGEELQRRLLFLALLFSSDGTPHAALLLVQPALPDQQACRQHRQEQERIFGSSGTRAAATSRCPTSAAPNRQSGAQGLLPARGGNCAVGTFP